MQRSIAFSESATRYNWVAIFLVATFFTLPISSTGKSIAAVAAILTIVFNAQDRNALPQIISESWCRYGFLLFLFAVFACIWSSASPAEQLFVIEKYSKLIYLPVVVAGLRNAKVRNACLHAFLAATLLTSLIAISRFYNLLNFININPENVFRNHIITGFMVSFACYLSLYFASQKNQILPRNGYLLMAVMYSWHVFFVNGGRTGYVIYILLMTLLLLQLFSWKKALIGMLVILLSAALVYRVDDVHRRVNATIHELHDYRHNQKDSSVGFRLQFHDFAHQLFMHYPMLGNGTGSFTSSFRTMNPVPGWGHALLEPHSQYWLTAAEFGVVGLILLGLFYLSLLRVVWHLPHSRIIGLGIMIPFLLGNVTDSLMFYSGSGYFFLLFIAVCLGERMESLK